MDREKPIIVTETVEGIKPCILLMVGAQGAGKSTFANGLVDNGFLPWVRINQDVIRNGKRGTRRECVLLTGQKLSEGYCCVVDRMNCAQVERLDFIELAQEVDVSIHAVIIMEPFETLVYRVAQRVNHEGNFQGYSKENRNIIDFTARHLTGEGWPRGKIEGLTSMRICKTNEDIAFQMMRWLNWGRPRMPASFQKSIRTGEKESVPGALEAKTIGFIPDYTGVFVDGESNRTHLEMEIGRLAEDTGISIPKDDQGN